MDGGMEGWMDGDGLARVDAAALRYIDLPCFASSLHQPHICGAVRCGYIKVELTLCR